ncbi:bifunctional adenosylcobinamide kinase/adenosylcobinamide-phosphate guanylyltransferase [Maritimibacter dapengensis]|uniref:Bifunctional adenosylcobalamin biosynthesis protein n=1 Tax=Maritimibacter dapengensis TaxID=2836868 RepID=A0ABS6T5W3_9RHOB|nr:bifunctional adenosylcobinamide kinase/adenosylcobinamide-phosphate guanylyltransferase [Maritimibacter dapengensis]MBV7380662.1 bifunctional adenosylcobinamide kinase/adenosylcobinamide-phosphate guanylyltransferase [Maritimibacter dapengensis]
MTLSLPDLTLVIGGAASGKSAYAERLAESTGLPLTYIATAQAFDDEMKLKIAAHQARRSSHWTTVEAPLDVALALSDIGTGRVVLLDCVTLWLSNLLVAEADLMSQETRLLNALIACPAQVVIVTNEVGAGIVPDNALARRFRAAQGRLNQTLAARASHVVGVMAGLPFALKGDLTELST